MTQKIDNGVLPAFTVESEAQLDGSHRQVVKVAEIVGAISLPSGAATAANQLPDGHNVTIANDSITISAASLPLPADAATQTTLAALNTKVTACNTGAVVVSSSALPTDAATATNQTTIIGHVDGIEGLLTTIDADTASLAVVGNGAAATAQRVTIANDSTGIITNKNQTNNGNTLTRVAVNQGSAGTTVLAAASVSNKHKIVGGSLTMATAGTLKFTDGAGDLTGPMDIGATGGFVFPTSNIAYIETTVTNSALSIVTTTSAAHGFIIILTEP